MKILRARLDLRKFGGKKKLGKVTLFLVFGLKEIIKEKNVEENLVER